MYTLGAGRILIKSIIIVCLLHLLAWKASWAHRTGENEKKDNDKIKKVGPNVERLWFYRLCEPFRHPHKNLSRNAQYTNVSR